MIKTKHAIRQECLIRALFVAAIFCALPFVAEYMALSLQASVHQAFVDCLTATGLADMGQGYRDAVEVTERLR